MKTTFKFTTQTDHEGTYCDCCGTCYGFGKVVSVNGKVVWEQSGDGHYSGFQTEGTLVSCVLFAWSTNLLDEWREASSEAARLEWNEKHVGNAIARTQGDWAEYHHENFEYLQESIDDVREHCKNGSSMPYSEHLQLQMIAIWIEDCTGQEVEIVFAEETL